MEIDKASDDDKRAKVLSLYSLANPEIPFSETIKNRAEEIRSKLNIRLMDSLHVATAEVGKVDAMLSAGLEALKNALGVVGATRFLQQYDTGFGDYTKEKYSFEEENAEDIYAQLKKY